MPPPPLSPHALARQQARDEQRKADESWKDVEAARAGTKRSSAPDDDLRQQTLREKLRKTREEQALVQRQIDTVERRARRRSGGVGVYEDEDARVAREEEEEMEELYRRAGELVAREQEKEMECGEEDGDRESSPVSELSRTPTPPPHMVREETRCGESRKRAEAFRHPPSTSLIRYMSKKKRRGGSMPGGGKSEKISLNVAKLTTAAASTSVRTPAKAKNARNASGNTNTNANHSPTSPNTINTNPAAPTTTTNNKSATNNNTPSHRATPPTPTTNNNDNTTPAPDDPTLLQRALSFTVRWLARHGNPALGPVFAALQSSAQADASVANVLIAVMRQRATAEEWELFRRWVKNAKNGEEGEGGEEEG
ncbi:hypothetical protein BU26DRAFT_58511 [Trematosphaeria pertusa]|uniref:Uncharacterized protein n=1 Tax=Trematosphaeria pertusa TaxID=390896 RepID=A0A6A6I6F9_9PLEO|nr:uncharacterized protein BU26DRAFT_58511 [Trematosphaeria pertusa]KAF2245917.1 hypothetical protein BU26DRAFT_58511 [Trematosphaeria pertusa]